MTDHEQQIDHDEHAAVTAEQAAERASELAHEQRQADLVARLRTLADDQQRQALTRLATLTAGAETRAHIPGDLWQHARRHAVTARLAGRAALTVERYQGYDLRGQVEALVEAEVRANPDGVTLNAAERVRTLVAVVLAR